MPKAPKDVLDELVAEIKDSAETLGEPLYHEYNVHDDGHSLTVSASTDPSRHPVVTFSRSAAYTKPKKGEGTEPVSASATHHDPNAVPTDAEASTLKGTTDLNATASAVQAKKDAEAPLREARLEQGATGSAEGENHDPDPPHKVAPVEAAGVVTTTNPGVALIEDPETDKPKAKHK